MKKGIIMSIGFMLIGLGYVVYSVLAQIQYTQFVADCEPCEAVVTKTIRDTHQNNFLGLEDVYITYTIGDTEYNRTLSTDTKIAFSQVLTNFDVGEKVTIYYKPENPGKIATPESSKNGLLAAISGFIVFVFGLVLLINYIKKLKSEKAKAMQ